MPDSDSVQFQSPTTGAIQTVPPEHWDEALKQGYKPTSHVVMWSPDGQRGMVPKEQMKEKVQSGYRITPETQFEKERRPENQRGFVGALVDRAADFIKPENLKSMALSTGRRLAFGGLDPIGDTERLLSVASSDQNRQQSGRSLPYRAISALGQSLGFSDSDAMETSADKGDWGGVLGNAAVDIAPVAIAEGIGRGVPALRKPITSMGRTLAIDPITERAALTPSTLAERWFRSPEETNRILDRRQLSDRRTQLALTGERDATRLNIPFAGDEGQGAQVWRDATRQNEPFAGEAESETGTKSSLLSSFSDNGPRFRGNEGRPATWTNEDVMRLAKQGNREAISQLGRRGLQLPENARYVAGDLDYPRVVYNPREVTRFGPEGTPIKQGVFGGLPTRETLQGDPTPFGEPGTTPPALRPEVQALASRSKAMDVPEWTGQQQSLEIERLKGILRNPLATAEERQYAQRILDDAEFYVQQNKALSKARGPQ